MISKFDKEKIFFKKEKGELVGGGHLVTAPTQELIDEFLPFNNEQEAREYFGIEDVAHGTSEDEEKNV